MKEWMTAAEIAALQLPDLPVTKRGVALKAASEGWDTHPAFARARSGRGGGIEYHFRVLPTLAQVAYMQRELTVAANDELEQSVLGEDLALSAREKDERDARLAIVDSFQQFAAGLPKLRQASHLQLFVDKYVTGSLAVEKWVKEFVPTLSKRSLQRWLKARKEGRADALAVDPSKARKGTGVFDLAENGRLKAFVLALVIEQPHFSAKHIRTLCVDEFGKTVTYCGKSIEMPPIRTFQWALKRIKGDNHVLITKVTNPDKYRSTMLPRGTGMLRHIVDPGQLWMIDASPVDALCIDGRHSIYIAIDLATRRIAVTVSRTPRASAVGLMMRKAILLWGVPHQVKTDNGSDFVAEQTKRLFLHLNIEVLLSQKYSPAEKAHVERVIKTFQHQVGPLLPGFIGHDVEDRKAIEERSAFAARLGTSDAEAFGVQLTAAELQQKIDDWVQYDYEHTAHDGLGKQTPFAVAAVSTLRPRMVTERALDVMLMSAPGGNGLRTVTAQGIRLDNYHYGVMGILPKTRVLVRQDPADIGRLLVFSPDGAEYLGEAVCPELAGVAPAEFWAAVREANADVLREGGKWMEAERRRIAKGPTFIDRYLRVKKAENANVVAMPKRAEPFSTPQIAAAEIAHSASTGPTVVERQRAGSAFQAQMVAESSSKAQATNVQPLRVEETKHQRFRRALDIEQRQATGKVVSDRELGWLQGYSTGPEYASMRMIHEEFGEQASL